MNKGFIGIVGAVVVGLLIFQFVGPMLGGSSSGQ